jgi:type IV secretion system protein VirB8
LIGPNVAQVRFQRIYSAGTNAALTTTWTATIQFQQVNTLPASERLEDPGGIIITNYQSEEDTTP